MSSKKMPTRSKIITAVVAAIAGVYLLVVGVSYIKSWYDFRPYHKLAVELNNGLGGGFTVIETKSCGLDGPFCPIVELNKSANFANVDQIKDSLNPIIKFEKDHGFTELNIHNCSLGADRNYCTADSMAPNGLYTAIVATNDRISINIRKIE